MKIALDVSKMHDLNRSRGIGIYAKNLCKAIKKYTDVDAEFIEKNDRPQDFDLIHYPFFDLFRHTLTLSLKKPTVVTIHDLIPIEFPKHYPPGIKGKINWQLQKLALKNVRSIIAVSETVKEDIIKLLGISEKKISVVHSAPSDEFREIKEKSELEKAKKKFSLSDQFVLYVGNINWNKNILNMTDAVLEANKNLVIIGSSFLDKANLNHPEKKSFKLWLEKYGNNERIKILDFVETKDVVLIMNLATCLVFVSFYEGFGLPVLEAQACGLPVITSRISATAEIAGNGAILVDPGEPHDIAVSLEKLFADEKLRRTLVNEGKENLKRFSWKKTALETVNVYEKVLNG